MSMADQFWQYAREALLSACEAKTTEDRKGLIELAQTWTQAALVERRSLGDSDKTGRAAPNAVQDRNGLVDQTAGPFTAWGTP
jgi:hypothetical protein